MIWRCRRHRFDLSARGAVMGILNVTPDSFSDGGRYGDVASAVEHAIKLFDEGALIVDVGGESTRPGAADVPADVEATRVLPVLEGVLDRRPGACLSIDTSKAEVARAALESGASILNDVTGFRDPAMVALAAESGAGLVVMHMQGTPRTMQTAPSYGDVVAEVRGFFLSREAELLAAGVHPEAAVYDPGIGFGKNLEHNLALLRAGASAGLPHRPVLLGVSRKSFIARLVGAAEPAERDWPTVALTAYARERGVLLHRVHEVKPNLEALRMTEAILAAD